MGSYQKKGYKKLWRHISNEHFDLWTAITVQLHDFLAICGLYIKLMKMLFHGGLLQGARQSKQTIEEEDVKQLAATSFSELLLYDLH